jgi:hypothetical protein
MKKLPRLYSLSPPRERVRVRGQYDMRVNIFYKGEKNSNYEKGRRSKR